MKRTVQDLSHKNSGERKKTQLELYNTNNATHIYLK